MAKLNRETFGRRGPTNVIAFPIDFGGGGQGAQPPAPSPEAPPSTLSRGLGGELEGRAGDLRSPGPPLKHLPPQVLGEVVISIETTQRQALESGWPFEELFDFYLIHGILHLLGYDHETPADEAAMEARTWELLEIVSRGGG